MFVYKISNKINGKAYIGMTKESVHVRFKRHLSRDKHSRCYALQAAFAKYGKDNFKVETLYEGVSYDEIKKVEKGLIAQYGTMVPNGYNLTAGGDGAYGFKHTPDRINAMRERNRFLLKGNKNAAKLSVIKVRRIRMALLMGLSTREIAKMYNVTQRCILDIKKNKTWKTTVLEQINVFNLY